MKKLITISFIILIIFISKAQKSDKFSNIFEFAINNLVLDTVINSNNIDTIIVSSFDFENFKPTTNNIAKDDYYILFMDGNLLVKLTRVNKRISDLNYDIFFIHYKNYALYAIRYSKEKFINDDIYNEFLYGFFLYDKEEKSNYFFGLDIPMTRVIYEKDEIIKRTFETCFDYKPKLKSIYKIIKLDNNLKSKTILHFINGQAVVFSKVEHSSSKGDFQLANVLCADNKYPLILKKMNFKTLNKIMNGAYSYCFEFEIFKDEDEIDKPFWVIRGN